MRNVGEYEVFKKAHQLVLEIYGLTKTFPSGELYGLVSQMRRAAYSIPMNMKEGSCGTEAEFFRYIRIAMGSKEELQYQLVLARDLNYIPEDHWNLLNQEIEEIGKMLYGILKK
jgi:four helix bundle protein